MDRVHGKYRPTITTRNSFTVCRRVRRRLSGTNCGMGGGANNRRVRTSYRTTVEHFKIKLKTYLLDIIQNIIFIRNIKNIYSE